MLKIAIINGPNLNLLGTREKDIYGNRSFEEYLGELAIQFPSVEFTYYQSNVEGELINKLHETGFSYDGIIPVSYTHLDVYKRQDLSSTNGYRSYKVLVVK